MNRILNGHLVRRSLWSVMLASHVPALLRHAVGLATTADLNTHLATLLGLTLASSFFVLKVLDVSWLRFRTDLRSCCVLALLVGLLHADVIARSAAGPLPPQQAILLTGTLGLITAACMLKAAIRRSTERPLDVEMLVPAVCRRQTALEVAAPPPPERLHAPHSLRGPPRSC